jgi:hypothetical protein
VAMKVPALSTTLVVAKMAVFCPAALPTAMTEFCNGHETCDEINGCESGASPCPSLMCDESTDMCMQCTVDAHCDDLDHALSIRATLSYRVR